MASKTVELTDNDLLLLHGALSTHMWWEQRNASEDGEQPDEAFTSRCMKLQAKLEAARGGVDTGENP